MKSLEHIIREIREGKAEKGSKKTLEGSIRKVMKGEKESSFADRTTKPITDDVGGLAGSGTGGEPKLHAEAVGSIGTDKYQGNQFKSVRTATPHIKPPAGPDGHSQAPENASRQRNLAKEKQGINRVEEGFVDVAAKSVFRLASPYVAPTGRALVKYGEKALEKLAPKVKPTELSKTAETPKLSGPKTEIKPEIKTEPKVEVPAKVEPKVEVPAKVEPKDVIKVPSETLPKTKPVELPAVQPKVNIKDRPVELPAAATKPAIESPKAVPTKVEKPLPFIGGISSMPTKEPFDYRSKKVPVASKAHHAKRHMKEDTETRKKIENVPRPDAGDRKSIEYVGRKGSDPKSVKQKTSRLAIIKNVIDEAKKIKFEAEFGKEKKYVYPNETEVVIGPNMKRNFLDVEDSKLPKDYENK